jgi:CRP-like cAMP-binding protein
LGGTKDRVTVAVLHPEEICGELAFLERGMSNASVLASDEVVEVDAIQATDLRRLFETFSGLSSRFYCSLAVVLARRLQETSAELARELNKRDD